MRVIATVLWVLIASAQSPSAPSAARPFPQGLAGTIAFMSDRRAVDNPDGRNHIFKIDLATGRVDQLTSGRNHHDQHPKWSPDGTRIVFSARADRLGMPLIRPAATSIST